MSQLSERVGRVGRVVAGKIAERTAGGGGVRGDRLAEIESRLAELEDEVQECRRLNVRVAELTDVVQELLLPVAARDEAKLAELLEQYKNKL